MEQIIPENGMIRASTVASMAGAWTTAEQMIRHAHAQLKEAEKLLREAFDGAHQYMNIEEEKLRFSTPDELLDKLRRKAWSAIVRKTNIRKVMSLSRLNELDRQLERGDLPDINEANILAMLQSNYEKLTEYAEDMIKEIYEWVRPHENTWRGGYKTNQKSAAVGLGKKIIIGWAVERQYKRDSKAPWRIGYSSEDKFTMLDNVFHILDGKGFVKTHHGPLYDAVYVSQDGSFETDYFKGHCFENRNMHLTFKRDDLLQQFNLVAGGAKLKQPQPTNGMEVATT